MDEHTSQNNSFKEELLKKIEKGEISMTPKYYFILKIAILVVVAFLTFVVSTLLISYTLFNIHTSGQMFLLGFGARGVYRFILIFPWFLLSLDALLLIFLDWLLKRFRFGYHSPIIYLFLGTIFVITLFGFIIDRTSLHRDLMHRAEGSRLPVLGGFYAGLRKTHKENGIFRGVVTSVATSSFTIKHNDYDVENDDGVARVVLPANADIETLLHVGDYVFIAGDEVGGEIHAYGIGKLPNDE